jgi:hypothetical protein
MYPTCQDRYVPTAPFVAMCPHCGAGVPGTMEHADFVIEATLRLRCTRGCGRQWSEHRAEATAPQRFWTLAPVQQHHARIA